MGVHTGDSIVVAPVQTLPDVVHQRLRSAALAIIPLAGLMGDATERLGALVDVLTCGRSYGDSKVGGGEKINVEYVSANPTGPLHVGHGRQAALGDAICRLLATQGWRVHREFYYNDAGVQIQNLALSVQARARELLGRPVLFPADGYHGEYIADIARKFLAQAGSDCEDLDAVRSNFDGISYAKGASVLQQLVAQLTQATQAIAAIVPVLVTAAGGASTPSQTQPKPAA